MVDESSELIGPQSATERVPPDGYEYGIDWSTFPPELFPQAAQFAQTIQDFPRGTEAFELVDRIRFAEGSLILKKGIRLQLSGMDPEEVDVDKGRPLFTEGQKGVLEQRYQSEDEEKAKEVSRLHEELRQKSKDPMFDGTYKKVEAGFGSLVTTAMSQFSPEERQQVGLRGINERYVTKLVRYNLKSMSAGKK